MDMTFSLMYDIPQTALQRRTTSMNYACDPFPGWSSWSLSEYVKHSFFIAAWCTCDIIERWF